MEPRGSSVSPLRTRSRTLRLRKTTLGIRSGRSNGWAECREKKIGVEPKGSTFFLTFPLIGQCYIELRRWPHEFLRSAGLPSGSSASRHESSNGCRSLKLLRRTHSRRKSSILSGGPMREQNELGYRKILMNKRRAMLRM